MHGEQKGDRKSKNNAKDQKSGQSVHAYDQGRIKS